MKLILILAPLVVGLVAAVAFVWIAGSLMARDHVSTCMIRVRKPAKEVWALISDPQNYPSWRPDVVRVERGQDRDGHPVWREIGKGMHADGMAFEWTEVVPDKRLVVRIVDDGLPFGGTWTFELTPSGDATSLRITETGFINPPPFRYISKLFGLDATIKKYLGSLALKLGEKPVFEL